MKRRQAEEERETPLQVLMAQANAERALRESGRYADVKLFALRAGFRERLDAAQGP